jgi:L-ribulokinase
VDEAQAAVCGVRAKVYQPDPARHRVYADLYRLYRQLHDAFGSSAWAGRLHNVMKELIRIRELQR